MKTIALWLIAGLTVATAGCAHDRGREGALTGVLTVQAEAGRPPVFTLDQGERPCLQLLLAPTMAATARGLDGRRVVVTGRSLPRPASGPDVLVVDVEGRPFSPLVCGERRDVLLVEALTPGR